MAKFGKVTPQGEAGYTSVSVALRAPRVVIHFPTGPAWHSYAALALARAATIWGGAGFILIPHDQQAEIDGAVDPALARVIRAYDPDYLADAPINVRQQEDIEPGWLAARLESGPPSDAEEYQQLLDSSGDMNVSESLARFSWMLCSPYRDPLDPSARRPRTIGLEPGPGSPLLACADLFDAPPRAGVTIPNGLDAEVTLAAGMRSGFDRMPTLPLKSALGTDGDSVSGREGEGDTREWVKNATSSSTRAPFGQDLSGLTTAWDLTRTGLVSVRRPHRASPAYAVVGSTAEDFALALALDRMFASVLWLPHQWISRPELETTLRTAWWKFTSQHGNRDACVVTSISLDPEQALATLQTRFGGPRAFYEIEGVREEVPGPELTAAPAVELDLSAPLNLACRGDYDQVITVPTRTDHFGGVVLEHPLPMIEPSAAELGRPSRPFWEVDVAVADYPQPPARDVPGTVFLADPNELFATVPRSSRDAVSYNPNSMGFVGAGATMRQASASVRLAMPSLRTWATSMVKAISPPTTVSPSDAGRRALTCARLWGSRSGLADDLFDLNTFLRAFTPAASSRDKEFPDGDGFIVTGVGGLLSFAAAERTMNLPERGEVRARLDQFVSSGVLRRGMVLRCRDCGQWDFHPLTQVAESGECRRCSGQVRAVDAWLDSDRSEPAWFYDLHIAVRELLRDNGDVPLLASRAIAAKARAFTDSPELDFITPGHRPLEIDIIALADDALIVGEAKSCADLGDEIDASVAKLVRIADSLTADQILLCSREPGPWRKRDIDRLRAKIADWTWRSARVPEVRVITGLGTTTPTSE